jgi:hypothetical protein
MDTKLLLKIFEIFENLTDLSLIWKISILALPLLKVPRAKCIPLQRDRQEVLFSHLS